MLRPETQDVVVFADGVDNIVTTQRRVARMYFNDGSIACACPPLQALLHIMLHGQFEGKDLNHADIRQLFTTGNLIESNWYAARLQAKQSIDHQLWLRHIRCLEKFLKKTSHAEEAERLGIQARLESAQKSFANVESPDYLQRLRGTLGTEPIENYLKPLPAATA